MRLEMYAVRDKQVGAYMVPFFCRTRGEAIRSFTDAVGDKNTQFCKYPADYHLFYLGEFDDAGGVLEAVAGGPQPVIGALEVAPSDPFPPRS